MVRLGIVGCNYGRSVLLPAFRLDSRCCVAAFAGTDEARALAVAREAQVPQGFGDWRRLVDRNDIDAVAICTPPRVQPEIAVAALQLGKAVFAEKPMAADLEGAAAMLRHARGMPAMLDFGFTEIPAWRKAKALLSSGAIGRLRHVTVVWQVENASTRLRIKNWKTRSDQGGGVLGNFGSHSLHYLEWFCGPMAELSAKLYGLPDDSSFQTGLSLSLMFRSGAAGSLALNCASYLGSGHRLEFYGEDGTLVLSNPEQDYMRGFDLRHARRPSTELSRLECESDPVDTQFADGRIAPVSRLARSFLDAIEGKRAGSPSFADGFRVQILIDAVLRSHAQGCAVDVSMDT